MRIHNVEQNSPEWLQLRCGMLTASRIKELITPTLKVAKNEKTRAIAYDLASQRITGLVEESFMSWDMERGHIEEKIAFEMYGKAEQVGFITDGHLGYSPDGIVGEDGLIEIKSVRNKHQVKTIINNIAPLEYMMQMQSGMLISKRKWCDFISYSNGMPLFVKRVERDEDIIDLVESVSREFELKIEVLVQIFKENSDGLQIAERHPSPQAPKSHVDQDF